MLYVCMYAADTVAASVASSPNTSRCAPIFFHPAFGGGGGGGVAAAAVLGPAALPTLVDGLTAIRQIIAGYRDSAAFLCHSADELELLLAQQHTAVN